jgi:MFS family permease
MPLKHRDFRLLWIGQTISMIGTALYAVAVPFQVLALGGTALQLGLSGAVFAAVSIVTVLFGGALVDRLPRRRLILTSDLASGVVIGIVAALGFMHALRIEHLYIASGFAGLAGAVYFPAMSAIIPELVPGETLVSANALRGLARQVARIGAPVAGGILVVLASPISAFALDSLSFFISFLFLLGASSPVRADRARTAFLSEVVAGLRFTFTVPWIWATIFVFSLINAMYLGPLAVGLPLLVKHVLQSDAREFGLIIGALGAGETLGAVLVGRLAKFPIGITMYVAQTVSCLGLAGIGVVPFLGSIVACALLCGVGLTVFQVLWETALQRHVPSGMLGRVTAVDYFGALLLGPISPVAYGLILQRVTPQPVFVISGALSGAVCLAMLLLPSVRGLSSPARA